MKLLYFSWFACLLWLWPNGLEAQPNPELAKLRARPEVERKVEFEQNRHRLEMLLKQWWDMPTDTEIARLEREHKSRYGNEKPIFFDSLKLDTLQGRRYREKNELYDYQNVTVIGWHPYWMGEAYRYYNYKLLTHVIYHSYDLNPFTGGYLNFDAVYDFRAGGLVQEAHLDSCKVLLSVTNIGAANNRAFFTAEPKARQNLADSLLLILAESGGDGIELNFEDVPIEHKWDLVYFVQELSYALREFNNDYVIAMSLPAQDPENVYDLAWLRTWVDIFVISAQRANVKPTHLSKQPMAPLRQADADIRLSLFLNQEVSSLDSIVRSTLPLDMIEILHSDEYISNLKDSLQLYVRAARLNAVYNPDNLSELLNVVRQHRPLQEHPVLANMMRQTLCFGAYAKASPAKTNVDFFLFKPNPDTLNVVESDLYQLIGAPGGVVVNKDSVDWDIQDMIAEYKNRLGHNYRSALVLGLPVYGSVWRIRDGVDFEGYMDYSEIRNWLSQANLGGKGVRYDKSNQCLIAEVHDSIGPLFEIYFDNSTTLRRKTRYAVAEGLGGVGLWALGRDFGYTDLWRLLEEEFTTDRIYNTEQNRYERLILEKSNKVGFTIRYQLRRFYRVVLATVFMIAVFLAITFGFSLLDWKVRDVMFYSGAFRLFYLAIFTVMVMLFGYWTGVLDNRLSSLFMGVVLGAGLTWLSTFIVKRRQERLP